MPQINRLSLLVVFALFAQAASAQFTVDFDITEPTCWGQPNGSVTAIPSGGTSPYDYLWSTGDTGPTITGITAGLYTVTVTDADGVIVIKNATVTEPEVVDVDLTANTCEIPIVITATGSGGLPPYEYNWSTGQTDAVISVPNPGTYCVTMTDQNLCGAVECITVSLNPLNVNVQTNDLTCADLDDGQVIAMPSGGTPPYTYIWSNGATTASQTGLPPGTYTVTVTDAAGCMDEATGLVQSPPPLTVVATGTDPDCAGDNDGQASALASGGTPPYTYTWSTGAMGPILNNIGQGTYMVTVTDANGCTANDQVDIVPVSDLSVTAIATNESCPNEGDGSITATPVNGVPPYTYLWSNSAGNMATINNLEPGSYSVTVIDGAGCSDFATAVVSAADPLIITVSGDNVTICDGSNGSATANIVQGTGPFTFEWSDGQNTQTATNLSGDTYSVTVTDANGCTQSGSILITTPPDVMVSIIAEDVVCPGEATGSAMAVASSGTPPYSYLWNTGATSMNLDNLPAGTYTVTVTDAAQCMDSASVTITESPAISVTIDGTETVCGAENSGEATAIVIGGVPPYTYQWSEGSNTQTITDLPESNYSVTVTDALGCSAVAEIDIDIIDDFVLDIVIQNVLCFGESTGSILAEGWGGTPPYDYQWSNGVMGTPLLENIPVGNYSVTVTDQNGCVLIENFNITEPPLLTAIATGSNLVCPGETTGEATATGTGGTPPYSYLWSNGETTPTITGLAAGTYTVTITDDNDCEAEASVSLDEAEGVTIVVAGTEIVCGEGNTGEATVTITSGTPPFNIMWSNGETTETIDELEEGIYIVTVTDANGCSAVEQVTVDVIDDFQIMATPMDVLCFGGNTGRILVTATGGSSPYTYLWSNGETTNEITDLTAGVYDITVTDDNGCEVFQSVTINEPPALDIQLSSTDVSCFGFDDGSITSVVNGGTPPYVYDWSNGELTADLTGLAPGTYSLTVTDLNGCMATASATVEEPDEIVVDITGQDLFCFEDNSGSASSSVSGGTPPYTYNWSTGASTADISSLAAGSYSLTVTDANGCMGIGSVSIDQPDELTVSFDVMDIFCDGATDGSITAIPAGGTPPYSYEWSNGETTQTITNLPAGTYTVTVTDVNECEVIGEVDVEEFPGLMLVPIATTPDCFGEMTGAAAVIVMGGTPPFDYEWDNGATTPELLNIPAGTYTVTVTDAVGCTGTETVGVAQPELLTAQVASTDIVDVSCNSFSDGQATITVNGGTPPYTYLWSGGQTTAVVNNLAAGMYTATVTDDNGCEAMVDVSINEPPALDLDVMAVVGNTCEDTADGSASASVSGGTPPYTYEWSTGAATADISNLMAGTYSVTVTDDNGCTADGSVAINAFDTPVCSIMVTNEVTNLGDDGEASIIVSGGTPPFTYLWSNGQTGQTATNLVPGTYTATVTDDNGCTTSCMVTLAPPARLGDYVWQDDDRDGIQDPNEDGIEGVMVILQIPGESNPTNIDTTFTDANGFYFFDVIPGDYKVLFINPGGLTFTDPDQGSNDALDSDVDPTMGMTGVYTIGPGEVNLTIDAGLYPKCDNITDPGEIGPDQFLCGPGNDPDPILNIETPSGGSGALEYLWMQSTIPGPFNIQTWEVIPGATGPGYDPGPLSETTYFARCARRECCTIYLESNIVTIEVGSVAVADIQGPDFICVDEPTTFFAAGAGAGAIINWTFSPGMSPQSATTPSVDVMIGSPGIYTINLEVTENGCTSFDEETITGTNSPLYCAGLLPIDVEPISANANVNGGEDAVRVSWRMEEALQGYTFEVQYSEDSENFNPIGTANEPMAQLGAMQYYEHMHYQPKLGHNYYRVKATAPDGQVFLSEVGDAVFLGDSRIAMLYPNPVNDMAVLELFETFGEEVEIEIINTNGARIKSLLANKDAERVELNVGDYPAGTYLIKVRYSKSGLKVLKMIKE